MSRWGDSVGRVLTGPLKALIPKNPWFRIALIALPILIVLALLEPVLSLFEKGIDLIVRLFAPLLETPGGRLLLLNLILLAVCVIGFVLLRARLRSFRSGLLLRRHLEGVEALADDQDRRAVEAFARVSRSKATPPSDYPSVVEDAKLKLARIALENGDIDGAIRHVTRVRERDLPKELARSHAQLRARVLREQGEVDPATLAREVETALDRHGNDVGLLSLARALAWERDDGESACKLQERIAKHAPPRDQATAKAQLLADYRRAGIRALENGDPDAAHSYAKRARRLDPDAVGPGILLGRVALARGNVQAAVREWGKTRSPAGLHEIASLLDDRPGALSPRELLESCPIQGTVLLVAREYARRGDNVRAERAARAAARELGMTPSVAAVLAEVLERGGRSEDARRVTEEAVRGLLADGGC